MKILFISSASNLLMLDFILYPLFYCLVLFAQELSSLLIVEKLIILQYLHQQYLQYLQFSCPSVASVCRSLDFYKGINASKYCFCFYHVNIFL